jgi:hypothetical protein
MESIATGPEPVSSGLRAASFWAESRDDPRRGRPNITVYRSAARPPASHSSDTLANFAAAGADADVATLAGNSAGNFPGNNPSPQIKIEPVA